MKVLLTGASSFTGLWFARALSARGFEVLAPIRQGVDTYDGIRRERVEALREVAEVVPGLSFGSAEFLDLVKSHRIDALCHHAAHVADYRSPDFDVAAALAANTKNFRLLTEQLAANGTRAVVVTGSVFEPEEGAGTKPLLAFSPYGLSKAFTAETIRYWCAQAGLPFGKFVVANPFGPFEEPRFCTYLMREWKHDRTPAVRTPDYVRDNIHVDALARAYANFVAHSIETGTGGHLAPSMYVETQGAFARRFTAEVARRMGKPWHVDLGVQSEFSEPLTRISVDRPDYTALGFDESAAWDDIVAFYEARWSSL